MKSKEFNIKLNSLSIEELQEMLVNTESELNKLKMSHKTAELENPLEIRFVRRNVARINTEIKKENYKIQLIDSYEKFKKRKNRISNQFKNG